jgi:type VI secretion system FHA domain protein
MPLRLEIISEHREIVGDDAIREFREDGGTIGRSLQNDWILPDPDRFISGRHATIDYKGGIYYLVDTSTNGVYVNGDCEPIGNGNPRRLFNGDTLRFGDFEMVVSIDSGESLVIPAPPAPSVVPDNVELLIPEDSLLTGVQLLDDDEITGDDDFQTALFSESVVEADVETLEAAFDQDEQPVEPPPHPKHESHPLAEADLVATDLLDSFLDGLGINRSEMHPSVDLGEIMQNAGEVLREFVEGTAELLTSRANLKNTFRLDQTTILPRHNNPIKLAANTKDSIKQLLVGKAGEYLGPRDAVREVCRDLLFHQEAFLDAMISSFVDFAERFDPDELQLGFDRELDSKFLTKFRNKTKYWDRYGDLYPTLTEKGGGRFPLMFSEGFVSAYERHIAEYKRLGTNDNHLKETVVLNESDPKTDSAGYADPEPQMEPEPHLEQVATSDEDDDAIDQAKA